MMALPSDDWSDHAGTIAAWCSAIAVAIVAAYKTVFGMRKGIRDDSAGASQNDSWEATVAGLRKELAQVRDDLERVMKNYRHELISRREAEDRAVACEHRSMALEARVAMLESQVKEIGKP